jgi:Guanylate-binding protein, C-terminal domain/Guanylate-binding protein, N-terminal domain
VEQKNRIRRLLKSFFKERDCQTMIRPLTNEEDLQNLTEMNMEELRPDFVDQVTSLRKKVISRVKPKTLNGKKLTGTMLATLSESYVTAINNGAIPNIETAWSYICKSECQKAVDEAFTTAELSLKDLQMPISEEELKNTCKDLKKQALTIF